MATGLTGRERILTALDGRKSDRAGCALSFYHVELDHLGLLSGRWDDIVDVDFVSFPVAADEEVLRRTAQPHQPDTRLGTAAQVTTYAHWNYRPHDASRANPLARAQSLADLQAFRFPAVVPFSKDTHVTARVQALHKRGLAVGGNLSHLGGELFEAAWRLRGLENFLIDLRTRPQWAHFLLDRLTELACRNARALAQSGIDVLAIDDDVGMPGTMMISPATWREFFKPRLSAIIGAARAIEPALRVLYHSDGFFEPIVADLVEIGVNAINPLQPEYMDPVRIRSAYGPRLALWGTVGHQTTFAFAKPDQIRQEVRARVDTLGHAGLVLCPAYDIDEPDIPAENIEAFLDAVQTYGARDHLLPTRLGRTGDAAPEAYKSSESI
jgi:uroporphyrinogen decarboxylase